MLRKLLWKSGRVAKDVADGVAEDVAHDVADGVAHCVLQLVGKAFVNQFAKEASYKGFAY